MKCNGVHRLQPLFYGCTVEHVVRLSLLHHQAHHLRKRHVRQHDAADFLPRGHVPQAHLTVHAKREHPAVAAEAHESERELVCGKRRHEIANLPAGGEVPQPRRPIHAACGDHRRRRCAYRYRRCARAARAVIRTHHLPGGEVPKLCATVVHRGHGRSAIGGQGQIRDA